MKNYRFLGEEMEVLGQRLDAARECLVRAKSKWAQQYWQLTLDQLMSKWHRLPMLHDGDAQVTIIPQWTVDYDFYEKNIPSGFDLVDRVYHEFFTGNVDLTTSWENNRAQRLAKAQ
jgi:hypothetical protein